jgi:glyoxylase-like metal-dependent hydrolase (beta-lactamase superfamily II)
MRLRFMPALGFMASLGWAAANVCVAAPVVETVADGVSYVSGAGGNITAVRGPEGLLVVDSGDAAPASAVLTMLHEIDPRPVRTLIFTHYHDDHTGGRAVIGQGATIIAHEACKRSLIASLKPETKTESALLPGLTYTDQLTLTLGPQSVKLIHLGPAHTAGDTVVVLDSAKVIVAGDLFFAGMPPYIDVRDGSQTANWITLIRTLAGRYPDYKVIPGHGAATDMVGWLRFADYLQALRTKVAAAVAAGKTRDETVASVTLDEFTEPRDNDFLNKRSNVGWVYDEMKH